jgi:threonine/homoserine/homoserine lactone efflux protein
VGHIQKQMNKTLTLTATLSVFISIQPVSAVDYVACREMLRTKNEMIYLAKEKDKKYPIQQPSEYIGFYQFGRGMLVALLNIPTIAFWIAMTTYFKSIKLFDLKDTSTTYLIICFISAAALGKLITLSSYALLADKFLPHLGKFRKFLPKLIGILLIMMGLFQVFRIFIFDLAAQIK